MAKVFDAIDERLRGWIEGQPMFFVGTAPSGDDGHVNVSPKGGRGLFAVTGPRAFAYVDLMGSGIETVAHLRQNGRIVIMFCAFEGKPRILRLHGRGTPVVPGDARFDELAGCFPPRPGVRAVIEVELARVADSCGFAVPRMDYRAERSELDAWAEAKGPDRLADYRAEKNASSLDGLPGLPGLRG